MANIITDLHQNIARVEALIPSLSEAAASHARAVIREAKQAISLNQYEAMREALDDLEVIALPKR
jgi:hypothetical protein